jgi:membrane protease YdiL (CAAX protease family)
VDPELASEVTGEEATYGVVLALASLALAGPAAALVRRLFPGRNVFFARWGFSHVALAVLFAISLGFAGGQAMQAAGVSIADDALALIVYTAAIQAAVALLVVGFARKLDPEGVRSLGLRGDRNARALGVAAVAYVAALPAIQGLGKAWTWLLQAFGLDAQPQALVGIAADLGGWELAAFFVVAAVVVPFLEELLFRGFLQPLLVQNLGDRGGVVVTAILFAAVHSSPSAFVPLLALSLVLGAVMLRTQRLAAPWAIHGIHNGLMVLMLTARSAAEESTR